MPKLRSVGAHWIAEAWQAKRFLSDVGAPPHGNLLAAFDMPPLPAEPAQGLERLGTKVHAHLTYRMSLQKISPRPIYGPHWQFTESDSFKLRLQLDFFQDHLGLKFSGSDLAAVEAYALIRQVLSLRCAIAEWKADLPLLIASIATPADFNAGLTKNVPRPKADRRSALRKAMELEIKRHPGESAFELLVRLVGSGTVSHKDDKVTYWAKPGVQKTIGIDRFENIFSEANAALAKKVRTATGRRRPSTG